MKKFFTLSVALMASMAVFAQQPRFNAVKHETTSSQKALPAMMVSHATADTKLKKSVAVEAPSNKAPRRSKASGVYYERPSGTYYMALDAEWAGYSYAFLNVAPLTENVFLNRCAEKLRPTAVWSINGKEYEGDENNDFVWYGSEPLESGYSWYAPTISANGEEYHLKDFWAEAEFSGAGLAMWGEPTPICKQAVDGLYGGWSGEEGYIYGTKGYLELDGVKTTTAALYQFHEAPVSPMYVESVMIYGRANDDNTFPIQDGDTLHMQIYSVTRDAEGYRDAGELLQDLKCASSDIIEVKNDAGAVVGYTYTFANREINWLGQEEIVPFSLDQEYMVYFGGFLENGRDMNIAADNLQFDSDQKSPTYGDPIDEFAPSTYMELVDSKGELVGVRRYLGVTLDIVFNAMFDKAIVYDVLTTSDGEEIDGMNVVTMNPAGGSSFEYDNEDVNVFAYCETFLPMQDEDGNDNYFVEGMPDWVTDVVYTEEYREEYGFTFIGFGAEPLPEGTKGRWAKVYLNGRGFVAETPIIIVQGEVDPSEWAEGQEENGDVYDFAAAAAAGENPENFNGGAEQKFAFYDIANDKDDARQDFKGYANYEGTNLPAAGHVWRRTDRINGNVKDGGLQCPNNRIMVIDGLKNGAEVTIEYNTAEDGKNIVFCPAKAQKDEWTIDGNVPEIGVTEIPSGSKVVVTKAWDGYFAFQVYKGMVITKITVKNVGEDTAIRDILKENVQNNGAIFNLAGQRIGTPVPGQIYIKNGRKFMTK